MCEASVAKRSKQKDTEWKLMTIHVSQVEIDL